MSGLTPDEAARAAKFVEGLLKMGEELGLTIHDGYLWDVETGMICGLDYEYRIHSLN
jgi:hypothetical protein